MWSHRSGGRGIGRPSAQSSRGYLWAERGGAWAVASGADGEFWVELEVEPMGSPGLARWAGAVPGRTSSPQLDVAVSSGLRPSHWALGCVPSIPRNSPTQLFPSTQETDAGSGFEPLSSGHAARAG